MSEIERVESTGVSMSGKAMLAAAMVGLAIVPVVGGDASAFQRGFGGGGHAIAGGRAFGARGFGGRSFGGFAGRGGFRGYGARYVGGYGRGRGYGYGYPGYYDDGGAVAASVIGGLALGALAASGGF